VGFYNGRIFLPPQIDLSESVIIPNILGDEVSSDEKHIYVDLENQTLMAYEGDRQFMKTLVSTGKWGRTPPGEYSIWVKMRATRMSGGSGSDYYNLPNVPYTMFFYGGKMPKAAGYALHGTYWHNNFGYPMSHGCVNLRTVDAEKLFGWANTGTKITIY
jgi:lipoprotein-anchoring transpeptidase ErfK/SrfK